MANHRRITITGVTQNHSGTVAGFQNIDVTLTGSLVAGVIDAEYSMGTDGDLPGGFPIVLDVEGTSPDFDMFWEESAQAIEDTAREIATFNAPPSVAMPRPGQLTCSFARQILLFDIA